MKKVELKQLFKEAVKEAFREELKDILIESIKSNKNNINESNIYNNHNIPDDSKKNIREIMDNIYKSLNKSGGDNVVSMNTSNLNSSPLQITSLNTIGEGTSLPMGEVPLELIAKFQSKT